MHTFNGFSVGSAEMERRFSVIRLKVEKCIFVLKFTDFKLVNGEPPLDMHTHTHTCTNTQARTHAHTHVRTHRYRAVSCDT